MNVFNGWIAQGDMNCKNGKSSLVMKKKISMLLDNINTQHVIYADRI